MKNLFKSSMLVAIVAAALVGCSKDATETNAPVVKGTTVYFKAEVTDDTDGSRASLTPSDDEKLFTAAWENTDEIGISAESMKGDDLQYDYNLCGTRKNDVFSTTFPNCPESADLWYYYAYYPYVDTVDAENNVTVPFGSARKQKGNAYNSAYDIMAADEITIEHAAAGKDDKDNSIVFAMRRLTAIAYFHFTTTAAAKSEKVLSVTLSATPSVAEKPLAADEVSLFYGNTSEKQHSCVAKNGAANSIKITYDPATAPTAADFKAWFNVLPGSFSDVKIAIETENYTATITRTGKVQYEAGKLYKVSTSIADTKWQEDYSGTYLILAKTSSKQVTKHWYLTAEVTTKQRLVATDADVNNITDYTSSATDFPSATDNYAWVVEKNDESYNIKSLATSQYITIGTSTAKIHAAGLSTTNKENLTITKNEDNTYCIKQTSIAKSLARNNQAENEFFAFYNSGQIDKLILIPYKVSIPRITADRDINAPYGGVTNATFTFSTKNLDGVKVNATPDKTVVTSASVSGNTVKYTVSANPNDDARKGTITLSAAGAEDVVVTVNQAGIGTTETIKISSLGFNNKQEVPSITQGDVTITFAKGSNSNAPKYYNTGTAIRVYGGNTFAVSAADKKITHTITNITLTFGSGEDTNTITTDVGTFETSTWTGSEKTVTFTINGTSGHRRLAEIAVTYK